MENEKRLIRISLLLIMFFLLLISIASSKNSGININSVKEGETFLYDTAIYYLKRCEGFKSKVYVDTDGSKTIGYGHHLLPGENYNTINKKQATKLLQNDLNKRINILSKKLGIKNNKALALGMLAYNLGITKTLRYIKQDKLLVENNISKILNYCHYRTQVGGKIIIVKSSMLYQRRQFELYIFNK